MKIAIVEDDVNIANLLKIILSEISNDITLLNNGWQALDNILANSYQLIILDLMLPGLNGMEVCKKIREKDTLTPILMLTSKSEIEDKVAGLEIGADDYLTKPFSNEEFLARAKVLLRRVSKIQQKEGQTKGSIAIKGLKIDPQGRAVTLEGATVDLTQKEFDMLYLLMSNAGRSYSRMDILDKVWGENFSGLEHTINSHINRLRLKIEPDINNPQFILTVWGIGYKFDK
jgi:DNA-binding response OmpR family regulator